MFTYFFFDVVKITAVINTSKRIDFALYSLFASNVFVANHANPQWGKRTAFTRSAITPPNVSLFG